MTRPTLFLACVLALAALALTGAALAQVSLTLPLGPQAHIIPARYSCEGGQDVAVQYINAGPDHLALLPIDGQQRIFVNVLSASGARYVAGEYEWWTKGDQATLRNAMQDGDGQSCRQIDGSGTD